MFVVDKNTGFSGGRVEVRSRNVEYRGSHYKLAN
jgi:hypothetical protein